MWLSPSLPLSWPTLSGESSCPVVRPSKQPSVQVHAVRNTGPLAIPTGVTISEAHHPGPISPSRDSSLADIMSTASGQARTSQLSAPDFHRNKQTTNDYGIKLLSLGVICYTAVETHIHKHGEQVISPSWTPISSSIKWRHYLLGANSPGSFMFLHVL